MTSASLDAWRDFAVRHLPSDIAEQWLGLLRPAVRLEIDGDGDGDPDAVVGRIGGLPRLPDGQDWPVWEGYGPLSLIASIDCAELPSDSVDIPLPSAGTLLFFFFDGQLDGYASWAVSPSVRDSRSGARVLYVPEGQDAPVREAPAGLTPFPSLPLTARTVMTAPAPSHPRAVAAFAPGTSYPDSYEHPICEEDFTDALIEFECEDDADSAHQIGGYAESIQDLVEIEVAGSEAEEWVLLAQFDGVDEAGMIWGDSGLLYWLIRPHDLAECRFDRAMFTWHMG
ncbi:YwqG family protein [Streptomyces sp. PU-14G]|uniref:YwqG family protein n=1 Tax=Streptomyces sp. PU-14G TaxID=2800808 RepID=UPI0034DFCDDB